MAAELATHPLLYALVLAGAAAHGPGERLLCPVAHRVVSCLQPHLTRVGPAVHRNGAGRGTCSRGFTW